MRTASGASTGDGGRIAPPRPRAESLGDPLARIQLAAGELARLVGTPRGHTLVWRITRAVEDLDRILSAETAEPLRTGGDLRPVLRDCYDRLLPGVLARGLTWLPPDLPPHAVAGDPVRAKRLVLSLLRAALSDERAPGTLRLDLIRAGGAAALRLELESEDGASADPRVVEELRSLLRAPETLRIERGTEAGAAAEGRRWTLVLGDPVSTDRSEVRGVEEGAS